MPSSSNRYRRALVTGGAGFIGSHLTEMLLETGLETVVLDNLLVGERENIPVGSQFMEGDICDPETVARALRGVDIVFHQAARVSIRDSFRGLADDVWCNVLGTVNILNSLPGSSVKKLVFASSMAVYGDVRDLPIQEHTNWMQPTSPYGISKLAAEKYILCFCSRINVQPVILRYFNTYGTRQTLSPYVGVITIFINNLMQGLPLNIFGDGEQVRDFIHVRDVTRANLLAMDYEGQHAVFNVGTGTGTSVNELAGMLTEMMHSETEFVYLPEQAGEPASSIADMDLCRRELGFVPVQSLETGLPEVIDWYRER